jgi:hypothetical protein
MDRAQSQEPNLGDLAVDRAIEKRRAAEFQAGHNPMSMSGFERALAEKEAKDRWDATTKYIGGIQGVDGGKF